MKKIIYILGLILITMQSINASEINERINILYSQNNIKEAFDLLLTIPEEERTVQNWVLLGNILSDRGKKDDAVFMYNSAINTDEKNYKPHYNIANIYLEQNQPNLAITEYKKAIKFKPDFPYAHYNLGCAYLKTDNPKSAKLEFFKAIELNNQIPDFYYNLAYTFKKLNNDKQAQIYLDIYNKIISNQVQ